jgi:hypothetical protein
MFPTQPPSPTPTQISILGGQGFRRTLLECSACLSGLSSLDFIYTGPNNTQVTITQHIYGVIFDKVLNVGDKISIDGFPSNGTLEPMVSIFENRILSMFLTEFKGTKNLLP